MAPDTVSSAESRGAVVGALQRVIVQRCAPNAAVRVEDPRLRLDVLRGQRPSYGREMGVAVQKIDTAGELLDPADVPATLRLDNDGAPSCVAHQQVDLADGCRGLAAHEGEPVPDDEAHSTSVQGR